MKECLRCSKALVISEFGWRNKQHTKRRAYCNECMRLYRREYYHANKELCKEKKKKKQIETRQHVRNYLKEHKCVDCEEDDPIVLEFDHLRDKKYNISDLVRLGKSIRVVEEEIAKCEVRCANCHRRKTAKDYNWWADLT